MRSRTAWIGFAALLMVPVAEGQGRVSWIRNTDVGIRRAQQTHRPLLFYVLDSRRDRNRFYERDQEAVLGDRIVAGLAERFVPVRLSASGDRDLLDRYEFPRRSQMFIFATTPTGEMLGIINPNELRKLETTKQKLVTIFTRYRDDLFREQIAPLLESSEAETSQLKQALELTLDLLILSADRALIRFVQRDDINDTVRRGAYRLLAALSTRAAVDFLIAQADEEKLAAEVLDDCTPAGAEMMVEQVDPEDGEVWPLVYRAAGRICQVRSLKSNSFWERANARVQREEVQRIRKQVQAASRQWRERYEDYR